MASCLVTMQVRTPDDAPDPGAIVWFSIDRESYTANSHYPRDTIKATADAQGNISQALWVNETGIIPTKWWCRLPSGEKFSFSIPVGTTTATVEYLRGLSTPIPPSVPVATLGALIAAHNADLTAHPGLATGGSPVPVLPSYPAGVAISALRVVRVVAGQLQVCDAANAAHGHTGLGITTAGLAIGAQHSPRRFGTMTDSSWNWNLSLPVYAGANGVLTQSLTGLAFALAVGRVITSDTIFVNFLDEVKL